MGHHLRGDTWDSYTPAPAFRSSARDRELLASGYMSYNEFRCIHVHAHILPCTPTCAISDLGTSRTIIPLP